MRTWFPDFWARLGGPDAISWVTFPVLFVLQITGSFAASGAHFAGREGEFVLAVIVAVLPMMAVLAAGWLVLLRVSRHTPRPIVTLVIFEVALLVRALVLDIVLVQQGFTNAPNVGYRILASHTSIFLGLMLTAYFVSSSRDFTRQNAELADSLVRLESLREGASRRLTEKRSELVKEIRDEISSRLERGTRGIDVGASTLRTILDDVVRPISYGLAERREQFVFEPDERTHRRILWPAVFRSTLMNNPLRPLPFALWMAWTASQLYVFIYGSIGWALAGTSVAVVLSALSLARWAWSHFPASWGLGVRALLLTLGFEMVALLIVFINRLLFGIDLRGIPITVASTLNVVVFGWVVALVASIGPTLRAVTSERKSSTLELRREVVMLNATYRQMTVAIARVLHGPIQDAVSVGLQKLESAADFKQRESAIAGDIYDSIRQSLILMSETDVVARNLTQALSDVVELWEGITDVSVTVNAEILVVCESDTRVSSTIIEIVREATSNAVRHGSAQHVRVHLYLDETIHAARVLVANDGAPLDDHTPPGLGTRLLEDLTLSWTRQQSADEVELSALVPFDSPRC